MTSVLAPPAPAYRADGLLLAPAPAGPNGPASPSST